MISKTSFFKRPCRLFFRLLFNQVVFIIVRGILNRIFYFLLAANGAFLVDLLWI